LYSARAGLSSILNTLCLFLINSNQTLAH
jgi:hypothetical protein